MNLNDVRILMHLARGQRRTGSHAERLEAFYAPQADYYDDFRERLLQGRKELIERLTLAPGAYVVELGGGTGRNALYFGETLNQLGCIEIVDLCPALLKQARQNLQSYPNVRIVEADATTYRPERQVDCVYFSYALTMIPDWQGAMKNAMAMLAPGGILGVVDFYVSPAKAGSDAVQHSALTRFFWPRWFGHDGVRLNPEHLLTLKRLCPEHQCLERRASVPYLPGLKVPYYIFVGRRPPM
jgi:S-adenosylmethionine-diacylgycerolhomoserine-N-methlytransferase